MSDLKNRLLKEIDDKRALLAARGVCVPDFDSDGFFTEIEAIIENFPEVYEAWEMRWTDFHDAVDAMLAGASPTTVRNGFDRALNGRGLWCFVCALRNGQFGHVGGRWRLAFAATRGPVAVEDWTVCAIATLDFLDRDEIELFDAFGTMLRNSTARDWDPQSRLLQKLQEWAKAARTYAPPRPGRGQRSAPSIRLLVEELCPLWEKLTGEEVKASPIPTRKRKESPFVRFVSLVAVEIADRHRIQWEASYASIASVLGPAASKKSKRGKQARRDAPSRIMMRNQPPPDPCPEASMDALELAIKSINPA